MKTRSGVVLGTSAVFGAQSSVGETTRQPDLKPLLNVYDTAMWVKELRFFVTQTSVPSPAVLVHPPNADQVLAQFRAQLKVGNFDITPPEGVHLSMFGGASHDYLEANNPEARPYRQAFTRWVLPAALLLMPGDGLKLRLLQDGIPVGTAYNEYGFTVWVLAVGDVIAKGEKLPARIQVPWVSEFAPLTPSRSQTPGELVFQNPFDVPLHVQRLVYGNWNVEQVTSPTITNTFLGDEAYPEAYTLQLFDSNKYEIAPLGSVGSMLVDIRRRAWTFKRDVDPRESLFARFTSGSANYTVSSLPWLSMIGTREEKTP